MLCEDTKGFEIFSRPDYEAFVCAACGDELSRRGCGYCENRGSMVLIGRVIRFGFISFGEDEFGRTTARRWGGLRGLLRWFAVL